MTIDVPQNDEIYEELDEEETFYLSPECLNGDHALCEDDLCECECHDEEMKELLLEP